MARIFITGSADGLGQLTARSLIEQGQNVVLHARNAVRGRDAVKKNPGAESILTGDLSNIEETKNLAREANQLEAFDMVIQRDHGNLISSIALVSCIKIEKTI